MPIHLVIANQTLTSEELRLEIARRIATGPVRFYVVVPATPIQHALTWDERESLQAASGSRRSSAGCASGEPTRTARSANTRPGCRCAMRQPPGGRPDHLFLDTSGGKSRGVIRQDVPTRLRRTVALPVTVVTAARERARVAVG